LLAPLLSPFPASAFKQHEKRKEEEGSKGCDHRFTESSTTLAQFPYRFRPKFLVTQAWLSVFLLSPPDDLSALEASISLGILSQEESLVQVVDPDKSCITWELR
jgi:hypothetical protein